MWIDTHCHLDASEFGGDSLAVADSAAREQVTSIVIPAVHPSNFSAVAELARQRSGCFYALGIHPMYVPSAKEQDLETLRDTVADILQHQADHPRFVAIGEIGLDYFVLELSVSPLKEKQEYFYAEQLKIARDFDLPVLLHVRRSQDIILKYLRRIQVVGGIAHAFNGSEQQAQAFIGMGFKLGFGGAMTFTRALQIRRLAAQLPLEAIVLETDAPDISPSWLHPAANSPLELPQIGAVLAELRGMPAEQVARQTTINAHQVLPRMLLA
ncbi:TatD family hydrolase [Undibacterium sp.]|jgi:TatD DNase family protein|uniref:TatD family hydrolase n=1 Tax=Undibacterium sp. TaxID=1914977 RepID=UPI002CEE7C6A|nr:TatD family hydrolase [Undibacterium sp.]HTD07220.1 TatD family hydrolase [Undibacterium sp.]